MALKRFFFFYAFVVSIAVWCTDAFAQSTKFTYEPYDYYETGGWVKEGPTASAVCMTYAAMWGWDRNGYSAAVIQDLPGLWRCQRYYNGSLERSNYTYIKRYCQKNPVDLSQLSGQNVSYPNYDQNTGTCNCSSGAIFARDIQWCVNVTQTCSGPACFGDPKDNGQTCSASPQDKQPSCGNPIKPGDGSKVQMELDYAGANTALMFRRVYNGSSFNLEKDRLGAFGARWTQYYDSFLRTESTRNPQTCYQRIETKQIICATNFSGSNSDSAVVAILRPDGKTFRFSKNGTDWINDANVDDRLTAIYDTNGTIILGWKYASSTHDELDYYDGSGKLISIADRSGATRRLTYSDGRTNDTSVGKVPGDAPVCSHVHPGSTLPSGRLLCVTDNWGRQLNFEYDSQGRIVKLYDPANFAYQYAYDGSSGGCATNSTSNRSCTANNLTKITYPDGKSKTYHYNESSQINGGVACPYAVVIGNGYGHLLNSLTGITDENGERYVTWTYDCQGRATSSQHAGGVEKVLLAYGAQDVSGVSTTTVTHYLGEVTNPLTTVRSYKFQTILGVTKNLSIDQPCVECGNTASRNYDANGNVVSRTDFNGIQTTYSYDLSRNLETKRVEGSGTSSARTITTEWHPTYRLPMRIAEPKRITVNSYDDKGNLLSKSVQATSDVNGSQGFAAATVGTARVWRYTYNAYGQVLTATGPRTDVNDTTSYAYDGMGNLVSLTNGAGQVTTLSNYDANGRVGKITDPNGLVTTLAYSPRGWLTSRSVGGEVTTYDYDGVGQLMKVTQPDGTSITYTYDDAHRLTGIADSAGNRIVYTLDAMGNRTKETVQDPSGTLAQQTTRVYDALNRLQQITGGLQ